MKRLMISIAGLGMLATLSSAVADKIDVMTQNQYVGTDLIGLVNSDDFNAAVIEALQDRAASLPTERVQALARLIEREGGPLVVKLPRSKGRKDSEYMHLFCGPVDVDTLVRDAPPPAKAGSESRMDELEQRIATLEEEVRALRERHD